MISLSIRKLHASAIVFLIIFSEYTTSGSYLGTNSSCGFDYPYRKCYAEYKVLRVLTPDENSVDSVLKNVLNGSLELDVWSEPYSTKDGIDNLTGFDILVSPSQINELYSVLKWSGLNNTILHHDVNALIVGEANMVRRDKMVRHIFVSLFKSTFLKQDGCPMTKSFVIIITHINNVLYRCFKIGIRKDSKEQKLIG